MEARKRNKTRKPDSEAIRGRQKKLISDKENIIKRNEKKNYARKPEN